jgi:hypothetical protein
MNERRKGKMIQREKEKEEYMKKKEIKKEGKEMNE